jgi:hypothetical protein
MRDECDALFCVMVGINESQPADISSFDTRRSRVLLLSHSTVAVAYLTQQLSNPFCDRLV